MAFADVLGEISDKHKRLIEKNVTVHSSLLEATRESHAIAVLTEWDEFKSFDAKKVFDSMYRPAFLFDGRNVVNRQQLTEIGFEVHSIGRTSATLL
jgi:UDPglucose 6-dehydrogenase